jgi:hypothetical protein
MISIYRTVGIGLIGSAILQITRMIPIAMNDCIKALENFPLPNSEDTLSAAEASGWQFSSLIVFLSTPIIITGLYGIYHLVTKNGKSIIAQYALLGLSIALIIYNISIVIDCFLLAETREKEQFDLIISFIGLLFAILLIITGFIGFKLIKQKGLKIIGSIATIIGAFALIGYITGIVDLLVKDSFKITGGLTILIFISYLVFGIKMYKVKS